jgi:hypothetical protein
MAADAVTEPPSPRDEEGITVSSGQGSAGVAPIVDQRLASVEADAMSNGLLMNHPSAREIRGRKPPILICLDNVA